MTTEKKQKSTQQIRLKKLAHQIKGLPENQKKECMELLAAYERWYDYVTTLTPGTEECKQSIWQRNTYQSYLQFALHYALTGDVFSRSGVIAFGVGNSALTSPDSQKEADLKKRDRELIEISKSIDAFGEASKEVRERFKKKLKSTPVSRLVSKKQVKPKSFGQNIKD